MDTANIGLGSNRKLIYDIAVKSVIFDYSDSTKIDQTDISQVNDIDFNNIQEFKIISNPRKKGVTTYSLKLKSVPKNLQDLYINSNVLFFIKIVEKFPLSNDTYASLVMENYFKVFSYSYVEHETTFSIDYELVTLNAAGLLFSQRYNTNMAQDDVLLSVNTAAEILTKVIDTASKYFKSNLKLLLSEYGKEELYSGLPLARDILFRTQFNESGLNLTAYSNPRLPVRNDLNDITIIKYILDYYKVYLSPTFFIFDDSRCAKNIQSVNINEDLATPANDIMDRVMRLYTYVFINTFNPGNLPKSSCWQDISKFDAFSIDNKLTNESSNNTVDIINDDGTGVDSQQYYEPSLSFLPEWRLNSSMHRTESLINKEDLRTKARSKIFLIHPYGGALNAEIFPEKKLEGMEDGPVNTIRIETEMDPKLFCASMKCEDYLFRNGASIYKANFKVMRYNTLDYNIAYDIVEKDKYNYVLLSFEKTFTYDGETKGYSLETDAEFIYLPGVINVDIKTGDTSTVSNSVASTLSNLVSSISNTFNNFGNNKIQDLLNSVEYQNLSPTEKIQKLKELSQQIADKYKIQTESSGKATYYNAKSADSKYTANGEVFDDKAMTAAHNSLPFNTMVLVENLDTGKSVIVRINDRGGFQSGKYENSGRIIDLTEGAANAVGSVNAGIANVKLTVVGYNGVVGDMNPPAKKR